MMEEVSQGGVRLAPGVFVPEAALDFSYAAASGPGGQNVNKRATKCTLRVRLDALPITPGALQRLRARASHLVTGSGEIIISADENRSQARNKDACLERLSELIMQSLTAPKVRRATRPSRSSKERRLTEKKVRGEIKRGRRERGE